MAVANGLSLIGVRNRLLATELQKQAVRRSKFAGSPEGFVSFPGPGPGFPGPSGPGFPGPVITTRFPRGPITPRPSSPLVPGPPPGGPMVPGGGGLQGLGELGCNLLSGTARDICLLASGFLPGAPGGGGDTCPVGMVRLGNSCIDLTALPPGGDPAITPALPGATGVTIPTGQATVGAFGLPALAPQGVSRLVRKCGRGMVLGVDNLCYPKAVLTGRSKFRKWRRAVRPPVTRRDVVAIRRAAGARDRVKELAKDVGLKIGSSRKKKPSHHK